MALRRLSEESYFLLASYRSRYTSSKYFSDLLAFASDKVVHHLHLSPPRLRPISTFFSCPYTYCPKKILLLHILSICFVTKTKIIIWAESICGFSPFCFSFQKFYRTVIDFYRTLVSEACASVPGGVALGIVSPSGLRPWLNGEAAKARRRSRNARLNIFHISLFFCFNIFSISIPNYNHTFKYFIRFFDR